MKQKPENFLEVLKTMLEECNDTIEENDILGKDLSVKEFYQGYRSALIKVIRIFEDS
jgi:hypothetical protein